MELLIKVLLSETLKQIIKGQKLFESDKRTVTVECRTRGVPRAMKVLWCGLCDAIKMGWFDTRIGECV
jgi:hypothetical protein